MELRSSHSMQMSSCGIHEIDITDMPSKGTQDERVTQASQPPVAAFCMQGAPCADPFEIMKVYYQTKARCELLSHMLENPRERLTRIKARSGQSSGSSSFYFRRAA